MQPEELIHVLQSHELWLKSRGKEGQQARLENFNLGVVADDFSDLSGADLRDAILNRAEFKNADLTETNFQGAELRRASFDGAILRGTNLRETDLQNANLENAEFLLTAQLAGSNVAGAKLPKPIAEFEGLRTIAEATANGQKLFVAMLGGCLYSWLTIGTTKDAALLTNSASSPLPIIGTALPIVGFYLFAPIVLLAMYFYFHLNMQRLWEALADLPAVFPDGRSLDKKADPWLLNGLVSAHFARLRRERPALSRVQQSLSILLAWWVVPVTVFVFWGRFLLRRDWLGTDVHIALIAIATGFGSMSYRLARATLRGMSRKAFVWTRSWKDRRTLKRVAGILGTLLIGVGFYRASYAAIENPVPSDVTYYPEAILAVGNLSDPSAITVKPSDLRRLVPRFLNYIGLNPFAKLEAEDVSTKLPNWKGDSREVKGAHLVGARMPYANAFSAFLVKANLHGADLSNADLSNANLARADFSDAILSYATLFNADLSYADLSSAKLDHAVLANAKLSNAKFFQASLSGTDLTGADLRDTDLRNTDLREVQGLTKSQIASAKTNEETLLPADLLP